MNDAPRIKNHRYGYLLALGLLALALFFVALPKGFAKYASYNAENAYLSWGGANNLYSALNSTEETMTSPHGGYTQTSVKCAVCHSTHRAASSVSAAGVGQDWNLLAASAGDSCIACHSANGASPSGRLIEVSGTSTGPHTKGGTTSCGSSLCHGSVHGVGPEPKYAVTKLYNLTNSMIIDGRDYNLEKQMDAAIAAGNVNPMIGVDSVSPQMKAYATGYVCYPCHGYDANTHSSATNGSRSVAVKGFNTGTETVVNTGHLSTSASVVGCDSCHDMVGVSTGTTAWPHANRGIEVYKGRFTGSNYQLSTTTILPDNTDATRYGLWMTAADYGDSANATPLPGAVANTEADWQSDGTNPSPAKTNIDALLTDGACIKCHDPSTPR